MIDLIGQTLLNRYRVDALLGRGGMSDVYKAWDGQRGAYLAMKVLRADLAEDLAFLRRFRREAQTLEELQHPHIVRFYGLEQEKGLAFILMDYVEGTTLRTEIAQSGAPLPYAEILKVLRPVCSALGYAHKLGVAHCDVKPANVLIKKNGDIILSDFGIARLTEAISTTLMTPGTPAYMAPEQWLGREDLDGRTDIYALGVTLYEMLTGGEKPFVGESETISGATREKIRWEHLNQRPPSILKFLPDAPPALDWIIQKCMLKDPNQRYQSVEEFIAVVEASLSGAIGLQPESTPAAFVPPSSGDSSNRNPAQAVKTPPAPVSPPADAPLVPTRFAPANLRKWGLWFVLGAAAVVVLFTLLLAANKQRALPSAVLLSASQTPTSLSPVIGGATRTPVQTATATRSPTPNPSPTHTLTPSPSPTFTPLPSPTLAPISLQNAGKVGLLARWGKGTINGIDWSPDGKLLAVAADNGVYIFDTESARQAWYVETGARHTGVDFSPDGEWLLSCSEDNSVTQWEATSGDKIRTLEAHTEGVLAAVFSPDGKTIASAGGDRNIILWQAENGEQLHVLQGHAEWVGSLAFSADGGTLASAGGDGSIILWNTASGEQRQRLSGHTAWVGSLAFSPDGKTLASGSADQTIILWDASSGQVLSTLSGHTSWVTRLAFSPSGGLLASAGADKNILVWDFNSEQVLQTISGHLASVTALAFSPDGLLLASGSDDSTIVFWDSSTGQRQRTLIGHAAPVNSLSYSSTGEFVASGDETGVVILWDAYSGQQARTLLAHREAVRVVAFSPNGRTLASGSNDDTVILWDVVTGRPQHILQIEDNVNDLAFTSDGQMLIVSQYKKIMFWDVGSGEIVRTISDSRVSFYGLSISIDGKYLAVTTSTEIRIYLVATGNADKWLGIQGRWSPFLVFSPNGQMLVTWYEHDKNQILLSNLASGVQNIKGHYGVISDFAFGVNDKLGVSASYDHTIILWDITSGRALQILSGPAGAVLSVAFSPDGRFIVSAGDDRRIWVWGITP